MNDRDRIELEIAVQDAEGARIAIGHGADRIELCQALEVGGLTPSLGILESVVGAVDPSAVNVLVRPRAGGFVYSGEEIDVVASDIRTCVERGVGGVVVGALTRAGAIDERALAVWRDAAGPALVTFHRAIDVLVDPCDAMDALTRAGVGRILSSGSAVRSIEGLSVLREMCVAAAGRLQIMAGGGVATSDIFALRSAGVDAVHLSARELVGLDDGVGPGGGAAGHSATNASVVAEASRLVGAR